MATKKKTVKEVEKPATPSKEILVEAGVQEMVVGMETFDAARGLARQAAGDLAAGASDLTRAEDALLVAKRVSDLSEVVATAGVVDLTQGAELLAHSEDVAALSAIVGLMGEDDLERGMQLARLAGELEAAGSVVSRLQMPVLASFLVSRSNQLQGIAVDTIVRSGGTRALSQVIAAKGMEIEEMGIEEASEGLARLAASEAMVERSEQLAVAGVLFGVKGAVEVEMAAEEASLAREVGEAGVAGIAEGAALLGAAEAAG
jgi:hypothetical protein